MAGSTKDKELKFGVFMTAFFLVCKLNDFRLLLRQ